MAETTPTYQTGPDSRAVGRVLFGLAVAALLVGLGAAFVRSLIPVGVEGRVESVGYVDGSDWRLRILRLGGRSIVADTDAVGELEKGQLVAKDAWSMFLRTDTGDEPLWVSGELLRLAGAGVMVLASVAFLLRRAARVGSDQEGGFYRAEAVARHWVDDVSG